MFVLVVLSSCAPPEAACTLGSAACMSCVVIGLRVLFVFAHLRPPRLHVRLAWLGLAWLGCMCALHGHSYASIFVFAVLPRPLCIFCFAPVPHQHLFSACRRSD